MASLKKTIITHSRIVSGIQRAAQTVFGVYLKSTCSRVTSASSALGVLNDDALYESTHSLIHSLKIAPRICVLFTFELGGECNIIKTKLVLYMSLAATLVGWIEDVVCLRNVGSVVKGVTIILKLQKKKKKKTPLLAFWRRCVKCQ